MFGRFLEIAIFAPDIAASVTFYERLGFRQLITNDAWSHRYGVVSDGRIHIGLHERAMPSPSATFVLPGLARSRARLIAAQFEPEFEHLGEEELHQWGLRDPGGQPVTLLEARTYSPGPPSAEPESLCGYFMHLSLPQTDFTQARQFWERGGFVAMPELEEPYPHTPLTSDALNLAFHARALAPTALLVFECSDPGRQRAELEARGIEPARNLPRGLATAGGTVLEAPEGTLLWSVHSGG